MSKNTNAKTTKSGSGDKKKAKKRDNDEDVFTLLGRYTVRAIYPWPKVKKIVALGIEFPAGSHRRKAASLSPEKLSQLAIYDKMYDYSAPFRAMIKKAISESVSAMRSYDTNQLKKKVLEYTLSNSETIHPPLSFEDKSGHGYWHNQPLTTRIQCTAKNPLHILDQLCRGDIISQTLQYFWTGPSSAMGSLSMQATKQGYASILNLDELTPETVAYACAIIRFSLSSETCWPSRLQDALFDYPVFFHTIVNLFTANSASEWSTSTLAYLNELVFDASIVDGHGSAVLANNSMHEEMMAAIAETNQPSPASDVSPSGAPSFTVVPPLLPLPPATHQENSRYLRYAWNCG
ncbi:hypothetical protein OF83DRAFT_1179269 [Amylostereum chailletii]|nr:hypothetical protein OF83DRAFT_1179269 [Amylostereum chailletii]